MGEIRYIKCETCGHTWSRHEGFGIIGVSLHCDLCGKELIIKRNYELKKYEMECDCGGKLSSENKTYICPACHSNQTNPDGNVISLWD